MQSLNKVTSQFELSLITFFLQYVLLEHVNTKFTSRKYSQKTIRMLFAINHSWIYSRTCILSYWLFVSIISCGNHSFFRLMWVMRDIYPPAKHGPKSELSPRTKQLICALVIRAQCMAQGGENIRVSLRQTKSRERKRMKRVCIRSKETAQWVTSLDLVTQNWDHPSEKKRKKNYC